MATPGSGSPLLTCWMLLAVLPASWQSTAQASRFLAAFEPTFSASSNSEWTQEIRAELLHGDHPDFPLGPAEGTTLADRFVAAIKRSDQRRHLTASTRRGLADFQTPVELKGGFAGEHVMSISLGTPPQTFTDLVDTGSVGSMCPLPWLLQYCTTRPQFSADAFCSLTNTCRIEHGYADNSTIQGTLTTEAITLSNTAGANPAATGFVTGCMDNNTEIFDNYDGIVGFGRWTYSLPSQLSTLAYLHVFSYCLVPFTATTTMASSLLFGTSDRANALGLVYTPLLAIGNTNYYVSMTGISVNGVAVGIPASLFEHDAAAGTGDVIFDSGTPLTRLLPEVYAPFILAIASAIPYMVVPVPNEPDIYCFNITAVQDPVYPSVTFHYGGMDGTSVVNFDLAPENVFGPYTGQAGVVCLAALPRSGDMIIGSIAQANHFTGTDVVIMRMGRVSKDCTV